MSDGALGDGTVSGGRGARGRGGRGLRREAPVLLAVALLVFVALAGFTLLAYRGAVRRLAVERTAEAQTLAERAAREAQRLAAARVEPLAAYVPPGGGLALFDGEGRLLDAIGYAEAPRLPDGAGGEVGDPRGLLPATSGGATAVGVAPFTAGAAGAAGAARAERRRLRLDLPATTLAGQLRSLAWLTPAVLALSAAAAVVMFLFVRALARPYEALLERARAAGAELDPRDELGQLVATFERALTALSAGTAGGARTEPLERLSSALGAELDGGFVLLDPEGRVQAATPAASELLRVAVPAPGAPLEQAFAARPELVARLRETVAGDRALVDGAVRVAHEGGETTVGVTAEPLRGEGGRTRGWLVVVADRTELDRRAAQERLAEGLAQLGELSAGVAHELRNSLASLSGWLALARRADRAHRARGATGAPDPRAAPPSAELHGCLEEAERETAQLARVVEDFLAFARPGTRRLEAVDLAALAARAAHDPALGDVGVALDLAREASFEGDAGLLERALRNLVANAAEAERSVGRRGPVAISVATAEGAWRIAVEDRGPGLPETVRARLFEPFASGRPGGAGLGLALARRIVLLHGGSIRLEPRAGGGTTAEIRLPRGGSVTDRNDSGTVAKP